jgi:hypothetical protein
MDTRPILDPVQVQLQRQLLLLQVARQAPYPPRILHTIAGLCDAAHRQRLGRRQVINLQ